MKSGSWSSYQAALPVEARSGGEPDDDGPLLPPPSFITVCWISGQEEIAVDEGDFVSFHQVPIGGSRTFPMFMHKASSRWFAAMAERYGKANVWDKLD